MIRREKNWYETLFENYGRTYDGELFTRGTAGECDFIEREAGYDRSKLILDIGCGTGRHSVELARRGYSVTGVDLSESMLSRARQKAAEMCGDCENPQRGRVEFQRLDARELPFKAEFDLAIMICEGAFPLMETDEMNFSILQGAARALRDGGKLVFTTLNGLFPLFHSVKDFLAANKAIAGADSEKAVGATYSENTFDLMTFRDNSLTKFVDDEGIEMEIECSERFYAPSEITWLLKSAGFHSSQIFGAHLGSFSRSHPLTPDDFEMLVVAAKGE